MKILTPKQMLRRLFIAMDEVQAGNASEKLFIEITQILSKLISLELLIFIQLLLCFFCSEGVSGNYFE